jgi:hypothetical protein
MQFKQRYSMVVSTLALVVALTSAGAYAGQALIGGKQIRNGSITSKDIRKKAVKTSDIGTGAVRSTDLSTGAVQSADIGEGQVQAQDITLPAPQQLQSADGASAEVGGDYARVDIVGSYSKQDPASVLEVTWTGTAAAGFSPCVFQLRVDGAASGDGAGVIYVQNGTTVSVSASALFSGLGAGAHQIEVWARLTSAGGTNYPCTVGPAEAGVAQTFVVSEQVV